MILQVDGHLGILFLESALLVECLQLRNAIEDDLVTLLLLRLINQIPDNPLTQPLILVICRDDNILDMSDCAKVMNHLLFEENRSETNDPLRLIAIKNKDFVEGIAIQVGKETLEGETISLDTLWCLFDGNGGREGIEEHH